MSVITTTVRTEASDAYCTTGSSPGTPASCHFQSQPIHVDRPPLGRARPCLTIHLLGPGAVGCALLRRPLPGCVLTGVTDSSATVRGRGGLDPFWIASNKERRKSLREQPGARVLELGAALGWIGADIIVDATATDPARTGWAETLQREVLDRGGCIVLAAKDSLARNAAAWLAGDAAASVGCNAVLGGTGRALQRELPALRESCVSFAIAGNASTTTILECIERGGSLDDGIAAAAARGFLESDAELDLRGEDAAVKLAIVASALRGRRIDSASVPCDDIRALDPALVRDRASRGRTTRLVARGDEYGALAVRYEEVTRGSPLASPPGRVVYAYALEDGATRVHIGVGLGAVATAKAALADIAAFVARQTGPTRAAGGAL